MYFYVRQLHYSKYIYILNVFYSYVILQAMEQYLNVMQLSSDLTDVFQPQFKTVSIKLNQELGKARCCTFKSLHIYNILSCVTISEI